ncbi:MAG: hypothetical protein WCP29_05335 [Acidobacteriota bacterium]
MDQLEGLARRITSVEALDAIFLQPVHEQLMTLGPEDADLVVRYMLVLRVAAVEQDQVRVDAREFGQRQ